MSPKPTKPKAKESVKKAERKAVGKLVPQPNGRGAIWQGAPANPVAGPGRPPDALRAEMRGNLADILPGLLARYTAGELDHIRFADFLAKYGLGTKDELSVVSPDVVARVERQVQLIASRPTWGSEELLALLSEVWT